MTCATNTTCSFVRQVFLIILCLYFVNCDCQFEEAAEDPNGNLAKAQNHTAPLKGKSYTVTFSTNTTTFEYYIGICTTPFHTNDERYSKAVKDDGSGNVKGSEIPFSATGILQYDTAKAVDEAWKVVGRIDTATAVAGLDWTLLDYEAGDVYGHHCRREPRTGRLMLQCGPSENAVFVMENAVKDEECYYLFEITSPKLCPVGLNDPSEKLSAGSILLIIFMSFTILYIVFGLLYQRCVKGARGAEQFPNISMWRKFGNLIADGCNFVFRSTPNYESPEYRTAPTNDISDSHLPSDDASIDERLLM